MAFEPVFIHEASYESMRVTIERVFECGRFKELLGNVEGKTVFVKPNMLGAYDADRHVCTHPSVVREVVTILRRAGAKVMVGDNSGVAGYGINERVAKKSGIMEASQGCFINAGADPVKAPIESRFFNEMVVSRCMMDADYLVNLAKMKTHSLTVLTAAVKNMFGLLVGGCKSKVHAAADDPADFGEALADIYRMRVPDVNIIDAVTVMEGNGPNAGRTRPAGKIIASLNGVAADQVAARMMNLDGRKIHHLRFAAERGMGPGSFEETDVMGEVEPLARFRLPVSIPAGGYILSRFNRYFYTPLSRTRLRLDKNRCTGCGVCVEHCPAGAMHKDNDYPEINEEKCIRCYCCFELCAENAWQMRGLLGHIGRKERE